MIICQTKSDMRAEVAFLKKQRKSVGLVPTMGYLHSGHMALVRHAAKLCDKVVVSIFVNPTQFGPNEDLDTYPRNIEGDLALLRKANVEAVFMPTPEEMYTQAIETVIDVPALSGIMQGALRPGHFQGVATVVTKLFNIIQPDLAVFGEKDFQQLTIIRNMVRGLDMPVRVIGHQTIREKDGLAISSRNVRLSPKHRQMAPVLNRALCEAKAAWQSGACTDAVALADMLHTIISTAKEAHIKSIDICDSTTLQPIKGTISAAAVMLLAVSFGDVLLIDQQELLPTGAQIT